MKAFWYCAAVVLLCTVCLVQAGPPTASAVAGVLEPAAPDVPVDAVPGEESAELGCVPDFVVTAPGTWTGTTCGAHNDCNLRASADHIYQVTIPYDAVWVFSLCGAAWNSYLFVGTTCCGSQVGSNNDACGSSASEITATIPAGTYYVTIEAYFANGCGEYPLNIYSREPCTPFQCQAGSIPEGEPVCHDDYDDHYNGGCNSTPAIFQPITCGAVVCGEGGTFLFSGQTFRDTDWYQVVTTEPSIFTFNAIAEFPLDIGLIEQTVPGAAGCDNITALISPFDEVPACEPASVTTACFPAGTYYFFVGPSVFTGVPCGSKYVAQLNCTPCNPDPQVGRFDAWMNSNGVLTSAGVNDGYGAGSGGPWFEYPNWWNQWWPNDVLVPGYKVIGLDFNLMTWNGGSATVAFNWSSAAWQNPQLPPSPSEDQYVIRQSVGLLTQDGTYSFETQVPDFCPLWVSVDVWGQRFWIDGTITHECFASEVLRGDASCNGQVNNFDITPFVMALTNLDLYMAQYGCLANCDCNGDNNVNNFDITPFVYILTH